MQEATLFVLKQVLDEFRTYDKVMDADAARKFLDHIRIAMHECEFSRMRVSNDSLRLHHSLSGSD